MPRNGFASEPVAIHSGDSGTDTLISARFIEVRELPHMAALKRRPPTVVDDGGVMDVGDVDHIHVVTTTAPPGVEPVARADG